MSYCTLEDLCEIHKQGKLKSCCEGSNIIAIGDTIYRFGRAILARNGKPLPEWLHEALENQINKTIHGMAAGNRHMTIRKDTVFIPSLMGNWLRLRTSGIATDRQIKTCPQITDYEWKTPSFRVLGVDFGNDAVILQYAGESRRG